MRILSYSLGEAAGHTVHAADQSCGPTESSPLAALEVTAAVLIRAPSQAHLGGGVVMAWSAAVGNAGQMAVQRSHQRAVVIASRGHYC